MSPDDLKPRVDALISAAVEAAVLSGIGIQDLRGIALFDPQKDSFFAGLEPFAAVEAGLRKLPLLGEKYGANEVQRISLQLMYEYFGRCNHVVEDQVTRDTLWADFLAELNSPIWVTRCVTNLRYFQCQDLQVDLGDGVFIFGRDPGRLMDLGFSDGVLQGLFADWSGFGASSFVLVSETSVAKRPDNLIMLDGNDGWLKCVRAIGAMRLVASGDVGISVLFVQRVARFNVGLGGVQAAGGTARTMGGPFAWRNDLRSQFDKVYLALAHLERHGYGKAPGNLDLALRAFMSTFDRLPTSADTQLVDAITALEALFGSENEIAFKLSFRVASLIAASDEDRASLFTQLKSFYDTRSRLVHGGRLSKKHSNSLASIGVLQELVRQLLRSLVLFAADDHRPVSRRLWAEELDATLMNASSRQALRDLLQLTNAAEHKGFS